jgi:hypothetical protein
MRACDWVWVPPAPACSSARACSGCLPAHVCAARHPTPACSIPCCSLFLASREGTGPIGREARLREYGRWGKSMHWLRRMHIRCVGRGQGGCVAGGLACHAEYVCSGQYYQQK